MKNILSTTFAAILIPAAACCAAPVMRDAATHDELVLSYRKAEQADPMKTQKPAEGPDHSKADPHGSIIDDSDVLCFNGSATLVPKRAVLLIPKNIEDRLKYQNGAQLKSWSQFYAQNQGWITTLEVSREQAEGRVPIPEKTQKQIEKSGNLVVATYQAGPISVLPPKAPVETSTQPAQP